MSAATNSLTPWSDTSDKHINARPEQPDKLSHRRFSFVYVHFSLWWQSLAFLSSMLRRVSSERLFQYVEIASSGALTVVTEMPFIGWTGHQLVLESMPTKYANSERAEGKTAILNLTLERQRQLCVSQRCLQGHLHYEGWCSSSLAGVSRSAEKLGWQIACVPLLLHDDDQDFILGSTSSHAADSCAMRPRGDDE